MTVTYRNKSSQRRSVFNLWIPSKTNKPVTSNGKTGQRTGSGASGSPVSNPITTSEPGKYRLRTRLTRSGSKILSLLKLGYSSNGNKTSAESRSYEDDHSDESSENKSPCAGQAIPYVPNVSHMEKETLEQPSPFSLQHGGPNIVHGQAEEEPAGEMQQSVREGVVQDDAIHNEHEDLSNWKLVDRFSRTLSVAIGQPTVIRRTHRHSRPSIHFLSSPVPSTLKTSCDGANDSSGTPSSPTSSNGPLIGYSTPPTPVASAEPSPSSDKSRVSQLDLSHLSGCASVEQLSAVLQSPNIAPSIVTVEAVAIAKVYLELYYNSLFQNADPRSRRQRELEQHIFAFQLTEEEQLRTRQNWILQENEYLRQCRVLKTNLRCTKAKNTISTAGYEVVKFLGKGSFGVVQLVREKPSLPVEGSFSQGCGSLRTRSKSLGMLKSAMDGARYVRRRRFMTGEKKEVFAMKVINKSSMIQNCQEGHLRAERDFLVASEKSRWIVPLIASFQDDENLYLVMDYMVGGDFLGFLIRKDIICEEWAQFYVAEMIVCIEEAHRLCWIHRDIKPDNFLISASGHLQLSDFGLAFNEHWSYNQNYYYNHRYSVLEKLGISVKGDEEDQKKSAESKKASDAHPHGMDDTSQHQAPTADVLEWRNSKERREHAISVVGTSQYMAPEIIRGEMYDGRCDWWSLGVILFECLYGFTPFARKDRNDTKLCILHHSRTLQFPRETRHDRMVSREAIDLISRILQEREYRFCSDKYQANDFLAGRPVSTHFLYSIDPRYMNVPSSYVYPDDAADIKAHPFFRGIPWNELHLVHPPMIPRVRGWEDTRYFGDLKSADIADAGADGVNSGKAEEGLDPDRSPATKKTLERQSTELVPRKAPSAGEARGSAELDSQQAVEKKKKRDRPRDKILRDKQLGPTALAIRKRGAFLGYTYRRPKGSAMVLSSERGRQSFVRAELAGLYSP